MSLTNWVVRKLGGHPPVWSGSYSRLAHADFDEDGLVTALVYAGLEVSSGTHWVRRWERERGMVWELPAKRENWDALPVHDGAVIFRTPDSRLVAADMKTGEIRWRRAFMMVPEETPRIIEGDLLYLGDTGSWLRVDPSTGENKAGGILASKADKPSLLQGSRLAVPYLHSGRDNLGDAQVMGVWPKDQAADAWAGILHMCDKRYHCSVYGN